MSFIAMLAVDPTKMDRVIEKIKSRPGILEDIQEIKIPTDKYNLIVVVKYKHQREFKNWCNGWLYHGIAIKTLTEEEYASLIWATPPSFFGVRLAFHIEVDLIPQVVEAIFESIQGIRSVNRVSGHQNIEITFRAANRDEWNIILGKLVQIDLFKNVPLHTVFFLNQY